MKQDNIDPEECQALAQAESRDGKGEYFGNVVRTRIQRRSLLKGMGVFGGALVAPSIFDAGSASAQAVLNGARLTFTLIAPNSLDAITVPSGYTHNVVVAWGDPMFPGVPAFNLTAQSPALQAQQFGFNCDFVVQLPLPTWFTRPSRLRSWALGLQFQFQRLFQQPSRRALLWVNHEYTSGTEMFPGYSASAPTADQVNRSTSRSQHTAVHSSQSRTTAKVGPLTAVRCSIDGSPARRQWCSTDRLPVTRSCKPAPVQAVGRSEARSTTAVVV